MTPALVALAGMLTAPCAPGQLVERAFPTGSDYLTLTTRTSKPKQLPIPEWAKVREARLDAGDDGKLELVVVFQEFAKHPLDEHLSVDVVLAMPGDGAVPSAAVLLQVNGAPHEEALRGHLRPGFAALWSEETGLRFVPFRAEGTTIRLPLPNQFDQLRFYSISSMWYPPPEAGWLKPQEFAAAASAWNRRADQMMGVAWSFGALAARDIRKLKAGADSHRPE